MSQSSNRKSTFRPEIQGVRAVAALLVAIYHIWFGRVSGGVDVFFVVSGFLITGSLLKQAEREGKIHFLRFWAGLIKRLIPAALLVITTTVIASYFLLPQVLWISLIKQASAAILYVENWYLAFNAVDYLADQDSPKPFQHFWALSTQGQFYVIWPVLIASVLVLTRTLKLTFRSTFLATLIVIFVVSISYSIYRTETNQAFAYFDTFTRMWEFALGGLLVYLLPKLQLNAASRVILSWVGLFAVASCGLILQVSTVFPGYAALWPTTAAALIILCGSVDDYGAGKLLSNRFFNWFGDISYSFYLWHWPVLTFYKAFPGTSDPDMAVGIAIIGVSVVLAGATTRLLEEPIRFSSIGHRRPQRAFVLGGGFVLPAVMILGAWSLHTLDERYEDAHRNPTPGQGEYLGARALYNRSGGFIETGSKPVFPGPFTINDSIPVSYGDGCHHEITGVRTDHCVYGNQEGVISIALVGGSHSAQWLPALRRLANQYDWKIYNMTKSACWFSSEVKNGDNEDCLEWNRGIVQKLEEMSPHVVFTTATRADGEEEYVPEGYIDQWKKLDRLGITVFAIRDNPWWQGMSPAQCVDVFGPTSIQCRASRTSKLAAISPVARSSRIPGNVRFLDLTEYLCSEEECFPVAGNIQIYRDRHHISAAYSQSLAPFLGSQMLRMAPELAVPKRR